MEDKKIELISAKGAMGGYRIRTPLFPGLYPGDRL